MSFIGVSLQRSSASFVLKTMRRTEELVRRRCVEEEFSFCAPVMAGAVHGCLLATFFQPGEGVELRLAFNSRGGGPATPAWDYQALIPHT